MVLKEAVRLFPASDGPTTPKRVNGALRAVLRVQPAPTDGELVAFLGYQYRHRSVPEGRPFPLSFVCDEHDFVVWRDRHGRRPHKPVPKVVAGTPAIAKVPILESKPKRITAEEQAEILRKLGARKR